MFAEADFKILPRADQTKIRDFAEGIVEWESGSATPKSSRRVYL
jgi:hypothetical protein